MSRDINSMMDNFSSWAAWKKSFPDLKPSEVKVKLINAVNKIRTGRNKVRELHESRSEGSFELREKDCSKDANDFVQAVYDSMRSFTTLARAYTRFDDLKKNPDLCQCLQAKIPRDMMKNVGDSLNSSMKIYGDLAKSLIK